MAIGLEDCIWQTCQGADTPPAKASAALEEVVAYRQDGKLTRLNPGEDRLVQLSGKFCVFPEAVFSEMFEERT